MYRLQTILLVVVLLLAKDAFAQPTPVQMTRKPNYFFSGSDAMLEKGVNCFVVRSIKDFERFFGKNRADTPQFSKEWMLILVMPATKKDIVLEFNRVSMKAGTFIEVYCNLNKLKGKQLTYEMNPLAVCTIPRFDKVKTVNFYEERKQGLELMTTTNIKGRVR